jgi:hypothetical protein
MIRNRGLDRFDIGERPIFVYLDRLVHHRGHDVMRVRGRVHGRQTGRGHYVGDDLSTAKRAEKFHFSQDAERQFNLFRNTRDHFRIDIVTVHH